MSDQGKPIDWTAVGEAFKEFGAGIEETVLRFSEAYAHTFAPLEALKKASSAREEMRRRRMRLDDQRFKLSVRVRYARTLREASANGLRVVSDEPYRLLPHVLREQPD